MEGWVDLGYPAMHRPGVEPAIFQSLVRRPTTTLSSQPEDTIMILWALYEQSEIKHDYRHFTENDYFKIAHWKFLI